MPQPVAYSLAFSFTNWTANHPATPQPGVSLDNEFRAIALTTDQIRANLALIQRDDGELANLSVGADQLSPEITLGLRSVSTWAAAHTYVVNDAVWTNSKLYRCLVAHTSSPAFATDLAASRWSLIFDLGPYAIDALEGAAITVNVDTSALQAQIDLRAPLAALNIFTAKQTVSPGNATTLATFLDLKPTDFGAGKPALRAVKTATAGQWNLALDDGAAGTGFVLNLDIPSGFLKVNGSTVYHAGNFDPALKADVSVVTPLAARISRAKRYAYVF